jgi:hypothetical protein
MSDPNEPTAPVPEAAPQPAAAVPGPPSTPYRVPEPPEAPLVLPWGPQSKPPRTILGPALSVFGVMLWAFVVAGQYTTSWMTGTPLNQGVAAMFVLVTTCIAWIASIRQSRIAVAPRSMAHLFGRVIGVSALSFLFFILAVFVATVAGSAASRNHDFFIAFMLVVLATVAATLGPRLTSRIRLERTHRTRVALTLMWIAGALLTLVAGIDLAANG